MAGHADTQLVTATPTAGDRAVLRPVEREDAGGVHDLLGATFLNVTRDRARWHRRWLWQCWENPWRRGRPAGWVLACDERILGHLGAVYLPYRIGMDVHTAMIGADFAVSEDAAALGHPLAGLELAGRFFVHAEGLIPMATTANASTQAVFARHGCRPVPWTREFWRAPVTLSQKIRTFSGAGNRLARRILSGFGGEVMQALAEKGYRFSGCQPEVPVPYGHRVDYVRAREMRQLLASYESRELRTDAIGVYHSCAWFEWRYLNHPEPDQFHAVVLRDRQDRIVAWAMVSIDDLQDRNQAAIMEMHVGPDKERRLLTLMCAALKLASQQKADFLVAQTGRSAWRDLFWELGFESRTRSAPAVAMQIPASQGLPENLPAHLTFWHGHMF